MYTEFISYKRSQSFDVLQRNKTIIYYIFSTRYTTGQNGKLVVLYKKCIDNTQYARIIGKIRLV